MACSQAEMAHESKLKGPHPFPLPRLLYIYNQLSHHCRPSHFDSDYNSFMGEDPEPGAAAGACMCDPGHGAAAGACMHDINNNIPQLIK